MGMVNATDYKSYGKTLEEELEGGLESPLQEATPKNEDEVKPETVA